MLYMWQMAEGSQHLSYVPDATDQHRGRASCAAEPEGRVGHKLSGE